MMNLRAQIAILLLIPVLMGAKAVPGKIHIVEATGGDKEIKSKINDIVEARIPNPALPVMVSDIEVTVEGAAVLAGVVDSSPAGLPGGGRFSIFVNLKEGARSGAVHYSYKNGTGVVKGKIIVQVTKTDD